MVIQCKNLISLYILPDQRRGNLLVYYKNVNFVFQNTAAKKTLRLGRVKIATHNLFQLINRHLKQQGTVPIENTPLQLEKVLLY